MINERALARIRKVTKNFSEGVARENLVNDDSASRQEAFLESCCTAADYFEQGVSPAYFDYSNFLARFKGRKLRILDVGVGQGESSVFLATRGHSVVAIEPSLGFCHLIASAAEKFRLDITPIVAVGEEIDRIGETDFDVVAFNSSLHHCDEPLKALSNARQVLKPGGYIFLCSELQLHPWVRKRQWYRRLETNPIVMGHYGGNEHAYYSWEYLGMLRRAGFAGIEMEPLALTLDPLRHIEIGLAARVQGKRVWSEWKALSRSIWYIALARLIRFKPLFKLLCRISIIPAQFRAIKP